MSSLGRAPRARLDTGPTSAMGLETQSSPRFVWRVALALLALVWLAYHAVPTGYFLRDDWMWLYDAERQLADPALLWTWRPSGYFRPLSNAVFALEYSLFGLEPGGYLVVAVMLHAWNAFWVFALSRRLFRDPVGAVAAAALFAVLQHPSAAVMWISSLVTLLAAATILPAVTLYLRHLRTGERWCYVLSLAATALALCAKESGVLVFPLLFLLDLHERGRKTLYGLSTWMRWAGFGVLAYAYWRVQHGFLEDAAIARGDLDFVDAARNTASGVVANFPVLFSPVAEATPLLRRVGVGAIAILTVVVVLVWTGGRQRRRDAATALAVTAAGFAPFVLFLAHTDVLTGRYAYLASVGAALTFGLFFGSLRRAALAWRGRRAALAIEVAAVAFLLLHVVGTNRSVRWSARFGEAMEDSRLLAGSVQRLLAEREVAERDVDGRELGSRGVDSEVARPRDAGSRAAGERWLLVAAPVENGRHLGCLVSVLSGLPESATRERLLDLRPPAVRNRLGASAAEYLANNLDVDRLLVWRDGEGLVPWDAASDPGERELRKALERNRRGTNARTLQPRVHRIEFPPTDLRPEPGRRPETGETEEQR